MSETQNNPEDIDPQERQELAGSDENGAAELLAELDNLPQAREVILPVIMHKGEGLAVLGDAVFDPETNKMVVSFNTAPGRSIAEFIGSGMLAAISFNGHIHKKDINGG
ncbi:hypothetical protein QCN37_gp55 [Arthrobacter phage Tatanka]|uniref:Uncharacterized protein n=1 Tax=Arthrobacter phage Tatanka TaxID=2250368 RepID=A0A2Z5HEV5_9CAUD|nr:hypothetical protein QCN37_gp55 [Arthrobacter phage Tatanka]AXC38681.1 hypothetical protein SEA_TATANKA_55 [Arthrobacter phage Tatanka]